MKLLLLLIPLIASAQLAVPIADRSGAGVSAMNCTVGQRYFQTDAVAGQNVYLCTATNVWTQQGGTPHKYGEAYFYTPTSPGTPTAMDITVVSQYHGLKLTTTAGALNGWTHKVGVSAAISSVADNGSSTILVTTATPHNLTVGDYVTHTGFATRTTYRGKYQVLTTPLTTTYTVARDYETSTDTGTVQRAFSLKASTGSAGMYRVSFGASAEPVSNTTSVKYEVNINTGEADNVAMQPFYPTASRSVTSGSSGVLTIADGDVVWITVANLTDGSDVRIWHCNLTVTRL